ncbi:hypothetical protein RFI_38732, partial [Reticulomyxa filosa]
QVLTFVYQKLASDTRTSKHENFSEHLVQMLMNKKLPSDVCRTHNLLEIVLNSLMHFLCGSVPPDLGRKAGNRNAFDFPSNEAASRHSCKANVASVVQYNVATLQEITDISYMLKHADVVQLMFSQRPDLVHKWCQVLCLLQNVNATHREVGHHVTNKEDLWNSILATTSIIFINQRIVNHLYCILHNDDDNVNLSTKLKSRVSTVLAHAIWKALDMIEWKSWTSIFSHSVMIPFPTSTPTPTPILLSTRHDIVDVYGEDLYASDHDDIDGGGSLMKTTANIRDTFPMEIKEENIDTERKNEENEKKSEHANESIGMMLSQTTPM